MGAKAEDKDKVRSEHRGRLREVLKRERKKTKGDFVDHLKRQQQGKLRELHYHLVECFRMKAHPPTSLDLNDELDLLTQIHMKDLKHIKLEEDSEKLALGMHKMPLKNVTLAEDSDKLALGVDKMSLHD